MPDAKTILIVDDSESDRLMFRRYIQRQAGNSYRVIEAETINQGIELWQSQQPDIALVDLNLTDGTGLEFLEAMQAHIQTHSKNISPDRKLPVIMLTGFEDARTAVNAMKLGASDYLIKNDITEFSLVQTIQSLLDRIELSLQLERSQQRERLVSQISLNISQFLDLEQICQTITQEIRECLQADRTVIYKFDQDMRRRIVSEALVTPWPSCFNFISEERCFNLEDKQIKEYQEGQILIANDVKLANLSECHIQMLESFNIQANIVVPIVISEPISDDIHHQPLWGLLIVHQCSAPRTWQDHEVLLLQQLSVQLAIAIQQAEIHQNLQILNASLERQVQERTSELRTSEHKTRSILNSLPDIINLFDADGSYIESFLNNIAYDLVPPHIDRQGKNITELLPADIAIPKLEAIQQAVATGEIQTFEQTFSVENELHYEEVRVIPFQDNSTIVISRDVSDRKQAEADLRASEARFQKIASSSPGAIQIFVQKLDGSAYFEYMSSAFEEINELKIEQIFNDPQIYFDQIHIDDLANFWEILGASLENLATFSHEWRIITPKHQVKWLKANLRPERRANGEVAWYGFVSDISDRKYAELELQQQYQRSQLLTEVMLKIRQSLNIEEILQTTAIEVKRILQADRILILKLNEDGSADVSGEAINENGYSFKGQRISKPIFYDDYIAQYRLGNFIQIDNINTDQNITEAHADFLRQLNIKAHITMPILQSQDIWGLIVADQCDRPRQWTDFEIELIQQLANQVAIAITQSQLIKSLQKSEQQRRLAVDLNHIGCWDFDITTGKAEWNENHFRLIGLDPNQHESNYSTWISRLHPEDVELVETAFDQSLENNYELNLEYRVVYPTGDVRWVLSRGRGIYDQSGRALRILGVMLDISDLKEIELALEKELLRNKTLLNNSFDGILILDSEGNIVESNPSFAMMLGYTLEEITHLSIYDIDIRWTIEELEKGVQEFQTGKRVKFETQYRKKDGSTCYVEVSASSIELDNSISQFCICRDITQRKIDEALLRQQEQNVRTLIENAPDIIARFDRDLRRIYINPAIESVTGIPTQFFMGKSPQEMYLPEPLVIGVERVFSSCEQVSIEFEHSKINGSGNRYYQSTLVPEFDVDGNVVSVMEISRDFTEQKLAENSLQQSIQRERMLNQFIQTIRSSLNLETVFKSANVAIANLLNLDQAVIVQYIAERKVWQYIAVFREDPNLIDYIGLEIPDEDNPIAASLKQLETVAINDVGELADEINRELAKKKIGAWLLVPIVVNDEIWGSLSLRIAHKITAWEEHEIEVAKAIASQLAIAIRQVNLYQQLELELAERKQAEIDLEKAKEIAESASKAKSEFLANMSHEIRTPMNGVLGMAQLLANTPLNKAQKEFVQIILDSGDLLLTVINDILDFSKIESGNLQLEAKEFNFTDTVNSICHLLSKQAFDKNINLQCYINYNVPSIVIGDSLRLRQILVNLIGNAIKFTEQGSVSIQFNGQFVTSKTYEFRFAISDTGIGIDCDRIDKLFQPFTQADASINRQFGGTGLGLAICKRLIELMGGTIWVESRGHVGGKPPADWVATSSTGDTQGSTFHFAITLPIAPSSQLVIQQPDSFTPSEIRLESQKFPIKILVVEDNILNQKIALLMLQRLGYEADILNNGSESVEALLNQDPEQAYDIVFMDVQMPVMDGLTATKIIRENSLSKTKPWIVALTADALAEDYQICIDAGMNDYISKPVSLKALMRSLSEYLKIHS